MRFASALVALPLALSSLVAGHPTDNDLNDLEKRQSSIVVTTGASGTTAYPRLEIRQMQAQKPNQWTLFILAMQQWQAQSQNQPYTTSYFGIAKIHGVPEATYNNVSACKTCTDINYNWGYCCHSNVLFPTWHRVYMALFEQQFLQVVNQVVTQFPSSQQATYKNAAATMRFPYWDWAALPPNGGPTIPTSITNPTISVTTPSGAQTINNPLYQITINDPSQMVFSPFPDYTTTKRYPNTEDSSATSQTSLLISTVDQYRPQLQQQIYQLLTQCASYNGMSNFYGSGTNCQNSLEGIHNTVHQILGGQPTDDNSVYGGNMYYLPVASFDPVFWLHHAMVDRILSFWQTLHPNAWGSSQKVAQMGQTWTIAQGTTQGATSPLTPFYKDTNGNFWNTNDVRNWSSTFRYTYPEYTNSNGGAAAINSYVSKLYGPSATATAGSSKRTAAPEAAPAAHEKVQEERRASSAGSINTYWANVKAAHGALPGSYIIYVFVGAPASEDPKTWNLDQNLAGSVPMLMMTKAAIAMSLDNSSPLSTGAVPLTSQLQKLVSAGQLASLDSAVVTPYLAKNMQWRVAGPTGQNVPVAQVPGLLVAASTSTLTPNADAGLLPSWSDVQVLPAITKNRPAGLNSSASWLASTVGGILSSLPLGLSSSI